MSQVWLVTGSSRGLGRAFAIVALKAGHSVTAAARKVSDLADLRQKYGERVLPFALDVTSESQANDAIQTTIKRFGRLDVLVNNAGYGNVAPIEDTPLEEFRAQIETNLFGVIILTKAALPYFREHRSGHFIQVTSIAGRIGPIGRAPYAAAKWGVEGRAGYDQYRRDFAKLIWQIASPKWNFDDATFDRSAASFDNPDHVAIVIHNYRFRIGLAEGEPQYDKFEKQFAQLPAIAAPTITLEGDANGAPHACPSAYRQKFAGKYTNRIITGGIGHNLPQEAPQVFAQAVIDVDGY